MSEPPPGTQGSLPLTVIMPVYNERPTVREILRRVRAVPLAKEILCVDDGSTDGTQEILAQEATHPDTQVVSHPRNLGKGAAVRTALPLARGDVIIIQDADLEYDPEEYPKLIRPILLGRARVVYGSRFRGEQKAMLFWHAMGNRFLTFLTNLLFDTTLSDMETGYKVFTREVAQKLKLKSSRWGFDPEITARILKMGYRIYEVPISYTGREPWEGKKIGWRDGVTVFFTLLRYRLFD